MSWEYEDDDDDDTIAPPAPPPTASPIQTVSPPSFNQWSAFYAKENFYLSSLSTGLMSYSRFGTLGRGALGSLMGYAYYAVLYSITPPTMDKRYNKYSPHILADSTPGLLSGMTGSAIGSAASKHFSFPKAAGLGIASSLLAQGVFRKVATYLENRNTVTQKEPTSTL